MIDPRPYFPAYPADFWGSEAVEAMTFESAGLYWFLLCREWQHGSLPADEAKLQLLARGRVRDWDACWAQVEGCFEERDGRLYNPRLERERALADEKSAASGKAARTRWERWRADQHADAMRPHSERTASAMRTQCARNANAMPGEGEGEERTVEGQERTPPTPPKRGGPPKRRRAETLEQVLERPEFDELRTDLRARAALDAWTAYKAKPLKAGQATALCRRALVIGLPDLPKAVDHSIASGYQGLFAPSAPARNGSTASQPMTRMERNIANLKGLRDLEEISD